MPSSATAELLTGTGARAPPVEPIFVRVDRSAQRVPRPSRDSSWSTAASNLVAPWPRFHIPSLRSSADSVVNHQPPSRGTVGSAAALTPLPRASSRAAGLSLPRTSAAHFLRLCTDLPSGPDAAELSNFSCHLRPVRIYRPSASPP
ncbi:extensin precursor [Iris pallida]|uniref:Extensin n=1 Tax=Iris pallida TaxID=29817 RepID=A0AAX6EUP1_IRIPA|nr:extensin precursor [Iris pallida]